MALGKRLKDLVRDTPFEQVSRRAYDLALGRKPAPYDLATYQVIAALAADAGCIDVGAHNGDILKRMLHAAPQGDFWAFEPIPHLAAYLAKRFADNPAVRVRHSALADTDGTATFYVFEGAEAWSGLAKRDIPRKGAVAKPVEVRTERLDDVIDADRRIDFIKIDVEGAEMGVLRGADRLIARWKPKVVFEHGINGAEYFGTRPEDVFNYFSAKDMSVALLPAYVAGGQPLSRDAFVEQFHSNANWYFIAHPGK